MNAASADPPDREFADLCRRTDARAKAARKVGEVSGDRLRKGAAASAGPFPRPPLLRRFLAALRIVGATLAAAAFAAATATACGPAQAPPRYFAPCPPGESAMWPAAQNGQQACVK